MSSSVQRISIGIVFSRHGAYANIGNELFKGAMLAVRQVNESGRFDFHIEPVVRDPGGSLDGYHEACTSLLKAGSVRHIVGCYTSSSRKEVIPAMEKYDGLLWYPSHYEGYESCNNVIYTGASPNQHLVPLMSHMLARHEPRIYCVGSNYIWSWENNRTVRSLVAGQGGEVLAEKYLAVGSHDVEHIVADITRVRPAFVFSSFIGTTCYAFMRAYCEAMDRQVCSGTIDRPVPVCSTTLSEPEIVACGPAAAAGHIVSSVYFQSTDNAQNKLFVKDFKAQYGQQQVTSADAEAAYIAVMLLASALSVSGSTDIDPVKKALHTLELDAPQGPVRIDPDNNHCYLTPSIGVSMRDAQFKRLWTASRPMKPDPYMQHSDIDGFRNEFGLPHDQRCGDSESVLRIVR